MKNILSTAVLLLLLTACNKEVQHKNDLQASAKTDELTTDMVTEGGNNPDEKLSTIGGEGERNLAGHVYIESNTAGKNEILIFQQLTNGRLNFESSVDAGGKGLGGGLGSSGALAIDRQNHFLFAVNAGSNSVSSFRIHEDGGLHLVSTARTDGDLPLSVTVHGHFVYVVNSNTSDIVGFRVDANGNLASIEGSHQPLSSTTAAPAQISFTPDGQALMITEKATNKITAFAVDQNGVAHDRVVNTSSGPTPFGFDFARGLFMVVSNANPGNIGGSSATSYSNLDGLNLHAVNGNVGNGQSSSCWVGTTAFGRFAFVANTASNNISSYFVDPAGRLFLIPWAIAKAGSKPADITVSHDNDFVYNINGGDHTLGEYRRGPIGNLENIGFVQAIPEFASGLVSY